MTLLEKYCNVNLPLIQDIFESWGGNLENAQESELDEVLQNITDIYCGEATEATAEVTERIENAELEVKDVYGLVMAIAAALKMRNS